MNAKKLSTLLIAMGLCAVLLAGTAHAGAKQRYRWEGVALGVLGAGLVGALLGPPPYHPGPVIYYWAPAPPPPRHWRWHRRWRWHRPPPPHWRPYYHHHPRRHGPPPPPPRHRHSRPWYDGP